MDTPGAQLDPIVIAQGELLALLEPRTGPLCDLRLRLIDERGRFAWSGAVLATGATISGTCAMTLATDGTSIWAEVEEVVVQERGVIRRMRWPSTTSWAETIDGTAKTIDAAERVTR